MILHDALTGQSGHREHTARSPRATQSLGLWSSGVATVAEVRLRFVSLVAGNGAHPYRSRLTFGLSDGNLTQSANSAAVLTTYAYDTASHLKEIQNTGTTSDATFTLDALGRYRERTVNGVTDKYGYVGLSEATSTIVGATTRVSAVTADGSRVATKDGSTAAFLLPDLHGNVAATEQVGAVTIANAIRYDAYGQTMGSPYTGSGSVKLDTKYQGRLDISPSADPLYDMSARFYAPNLGTFTQLDSYAGSAQNPATMNRFLYALGNPTSLIDPTGHQGCNPNKKCNAGGGRVIVVDNDSNVTVIQSASSSSNNNSTKDDDSSPVTTVRTPPPDAYKFTNDQKLIIAALAERVADYKAACSSITIYNADGCLDDTSAGFFKATWAADQLVFLTLAGQETWYAAGSSATGLRTADDIVEGIAPIATGASSRAVGTTIRASERGLAIVESHLSKFESTAANAAMVSRIRAALDRGEKLSGPDAQFYLHEIAESRLIQRTQGTGLAWEERAYNAHREALAKYNHSEFGNYHPSVVEQFADEFSDSWRRFWGLND